MGNIPSHMQFQSDWRVGGRRRRTMSVRGAIGMAIGLAGLAAVAFLALHA